MGGGNSLLGVVTASMSFHNTKLMGFFTETVLVTHAPIVKNGCDCTIRCGDTVGAQELTDKQKKEHAWFLPYTLILGVNREHFDPARGKGGSAIWEFDVSKLPRKSGEKITNIQLKVIAFRIHAGLHTPSKSWQDSKAKGERKWGRVSLAVGQHGFEMLDDIILETRMEHGENIGFNQTRSFPEIQEWILKARQEGDGKLRVKLAVNSQVTRDVDQVRLESIVVETKQVRQWVWMVLGALLSSVIGTVAYLILNGKQ